MRALAMSSADLTSSISHPTCPFPTRAHVSEQASPLQRLAGIEGRIEYPGSAPATQPPRAASLAREGSARNIPEHEAQ
jgi:hypothetical protein